MNKDEAAAGWKMVFVWLFTTLASISAEKWAAIVAVAFTILQIYVLIRDKILRRTADKD